ncbi:hypothetical protein WKH44_16185 [Pantoea agglomerans]|uniref:hypothetical protein n=1 Tax=Enterobacter agglomerans TaxID=549 RepID=UPI003C7AFEBB
MNKLTANKCREMFLNLFEDKRQDGITLKEDLYMQALEIALPILEKQEQVEDWIEWGGGDCPVYSGELVDLKLRDGRVTKSFFAGGGDWQCHGYGTDIIAYRIIPEQPTNQNGEQ